MHSNSRRTNSTPRWPLAAVLAGICAGASANPADGIYAGSAYFGDSACASSSFDITVLVRDGEVYAPEQVGRAGDFGRIEFTFQDDVHFRGQLSGGRIEGRIDVDFVLDCTGSFRMLKRGPAPATGMPGGLQPMQDGDRPRRKPPHPGP